MQTLQQRLTEREREIGRLKEKLRDLTKKLQQQQQLYNSKVFSRLSMTMTTRFRPVAHSVARRRVPVTQSDYKQKKKEKSLPKWRLGERGITLLGFRAVGVPQVLDIHESVSFTSFRRNRFDLARGKFITCFPRGVYRQFLCSYMSIKD